MKKAKFTGKLSLNKETVAKLNDEQMGKVNGGITLTMFFCSPFPPFTVTVPCTGGEKTLKAGCTFDTNGNCA